MNINCFRKLLSYLIASLIFLLTILSSGVGLYARTLPKSSTGVNKKQQEPRLFLIAVVDTNDKDIGSRCETDMDNIRFELDNLAGWMQTQLKRLLRVIN